MNISYAWSLKSPELFYRWSCIVYSEKIVVGDLFSALTARKLDPHRWNMEPFIYIFIACAVIFSGLYCFCRSSSSLDSQPSEREQFTFMSTVDEELIIQLPVYVELAQEQQTVPSCTNSSVRRPDTPPPSYNEVANR